jgi:phosphoserine phosphatase RsbX
VDTRALNIATATRPYPGEIANGDQVQVDWHADGCRIAVIDGLGHGPDAQADAELAAATLARYPELPLDEALRACHLALRSRRGAAISMAGVDLKRRLLTFAGIGNVEARLWQPDRTERLTAFRGIVGVAMRSVRLFQIPLAQTWKLILHTDGISARFDNSAFAGTGDLEGLAQGILDRWGRERDDATVVLVAPELPHR